MKRDTIMREFRQIPEVLQKQLLIKAGLSALCFIVAVSLLMLAQDASLSLPPACMFVFFAVTVFNLLRRITSAEYVIVSGKCIEAGATSLKRRIKYIIIETEDTKIKVMPRGHLKKTSPGSQLKLYIADNTPVYEQNGLHILYYCIALETVK